MSLIDALTNDVTEEPVLEEVHRLLSEGSSVTAISDDCETPLHLAAQKDFAEVAAALVYGGADIEATDFKGEC